MIDKEITDKINQLLNNGFTFGDHKTEEERDEIEQELIEWYGKNGFGAFIEEEMVYVVDSKYENIMMLEITKNSIYFNPHEHIYLLDAVVVTLEYVTEKLTKTYGMPQLIDSFNEGGHYSDYNDWMDSIANKERQFFAFWSKNNGLQLPNNLNNIALGVFVEDTWGGNVY